MSFGYKIVLIFPNFRLYQKFIVTPHQPPLGLGYLAAVLKKNGISYKIIDAAANNISHYGLIRLIKQYNPEYIGYTLNISTAYSAIREVKLLRKHFPHIIIIMGGPWAHVNYEYLIHHKIADIVCFGEGEYTLVKLIESHKDIKLLEKIDGIAYLFEDKIIKTNQCSVIQDIDKIPHPEWEQFPIYRYDVIHRDTPFFPLMTIRGCPYDCINCTKVIHGYTPRMRSIENIIEELDYLKNSFNAKELIIEDDIFNIDLERAKRLLRAIIKKKYNFKIQLSNGIRADKIDKEFARLLRLAGCYRVAIGIESGSSAVIRFLQKKLDLNVLKKSIEILRNEKIVVYGYFILGLPIETKNSLIYSIDFADNINLDATNFFGLIVFPGTKLYNYIMRTKNMNTKSYKMNDINYHTTKLSFIPSNFTQKDYDKARFYYIIRFFFNPRRFFRFIRTLNINEIVYVLKRGISFFLNKLFD